MSETTDRVASEAKELVSKLELERRAAENPYGLVAAGFGLGYVLGGGLFTPTTERVIRLGLKVATIPLVQKALLDVVEAAVDGALAATEPDEP